MTDIEGVILNLGVLSSRLNKARGILLVMNDNGSTTLDVTSSDIPTISKTPRNENYDEILERSLKAITVVGITDLKDAIFNANPNKINVINVKIEQDYQSVLF